MKSVQFFLFLVAFVAAELPVTPPAIIWGVELPKSPSIFDYVSRAKLVEILQPLQAKPHMIIAYFANDLTSKDFSCLAPDCFPFLRQVQPSNYYSQVHQPLAALQTTAELRNQSLIWDNETSLLEVPCSPHEIHVFNFTDRQLNNHDTFMKAVSGALKDCPLIQIYTAHWEELEAQQRRLERVANKENRQQFARVQQPMTSRRDAPEATVLRNMLAIVSITKITLAEEIKIGLITTYKRTEIDILDTPLKLTLADDRSILMGFVVGIDTSMGPLAIDVLPITGNWRIWRLHYDKQTFTSRDLLFYSRKFSFCCSQMIFYSEHGSTLTFSMFFMDVELNRAEFSPHDMDYVAKKCWMCQHLVTPGVTQVLFTLALLLLILGIGLSMLLTIGRPKKFASANDPDLYVKGYAEH